MNSPGVVVVRPASHMMPSNSAQSARAEGCAELDQGVDTRDASASLQETDLGAVQRGAKADRFLAQSGAPSGSTEVGGKVRRDLL